MDQQVDRRKYLSVAATTAGTVAAGCIDIDINETERDAFRLTSYGIDDVALGPTYRPYLIDPLDVDASYSVALSDTYTQNAIEELVDTGSLDTRGWALSYRTDWGPTERDARTCFEHDGAYYRVHVESSDHVERERWVFGFDWTDGDPPTDATVVTPSDTGLSPTDQRIVEAASAQIPPEGEREVTYEPPRISRSVVFHDELDPDDSDLVPQPPFDYLDRDGEYVRAVAHHVPVTRPERTFSAERVAKSRDGYREYAEETFPDAHFSDVDLSEEATEVLESAISTDEGLAHEEEPPLSDGLGTVLAHLGIADSLEPYDSYDRLVVFRNALAEYRNRWYEFTLFVDPEPREG
ncbi:hypothetical protein [Halovivax cerinus]|uniref:Uncharacterized protein n=1 Tax=Halovivax cerinus TaxID=1487865 RepID=A0ABD5NJ04_9EURY|nr:hypothetical protein [Halovivax cerinus]